jgi:hypothetical protein
MGTSWNAKTSRHFRSFTIKQRTFVFTDILADAFTNVFAKVNLLMAPQLNYPAIMIQIRVYHVLIGHIAIAHIAPFLAPGVADNKNTIGIGVANTKHGMATHMFLIVRIWHGNQSTIATCTIK